MLTRSASTVLVAAVTLAIGGCGGGFPPKELRNARVMVNEAAIQKKLVYENQSLGLVRGISQQGGSDQFAVFGHSGNCLLTLSGDSPTCETLPPGVVPPVSIGTFLSAKYISADFNGDGTSEKLRPVEGEGFLLENLAGTELARTQLERYWGAPNFEDDFSYWYEPAVTWSRPRFLLVSIPDTLHVFDNNLTEVRHLPAPGMQSPLHISAGAPLDTVAARPFASVFTGRGGWHRSILFIHSTDDQLLYKEVLDDDFQALWPLPAEGGHYRFLLGGRGQVWEYSFRLPGD